jgi:uncharacterized protein
MALLLLALAILAKGYWNATRDPIIHRATVSVDQTHKQGTPIWPLGERQIKVLLISDIHVAGPERLERLVRQFNALKPDLVLIAGDLVSEKRLATHIYSPAEIVAPLGKLKARFGVVATLGNHDHWFDPAALEAELEKQGVTVLKNEAVLRGPLAIGGVDDDFSGHDDVEATFTGLDKLPSPLRILVSHSPDVVPELPSPVTAVFAGHTHCGQIALPLIGELSYVSRYGDRFACGDISDLHEKGWRQRVFVGAGLGTSILPLRYGAMPDAWLVTLRP